MGKPTINQIKTLALEYGDACVSYAASNHDNYASYIAEQNVIMSLYKLMGAIKLYGGE